MRNQELTNLVRLGSKFNQEKLTWAQSLKTGDEVAIDITGKGTLFEIATIKSVNKSAIHLTNGIGLNSDGSITGSQGGAIVPLTEEIRKCIREL